MLFIYKIQPSRDEAFAEGFAESEQQKISEHFDYLKRLTNEGTVLLAGKTPNIPHHGFGMVIFKAESEEAARRILDDDPAARNNVFVAELYPFGAALPNGLIQA
jgi:uncharacterized protein YciI